MNRRSFIKAASCGVLLTGALLSVSYVAAESCPLIPGSLGMLYGSTLCVGCQACVTKYQDTNFPERNPQREQTWSNNDELSSYTSNTIQAWTSGTGVNKDQEKNGYAYTKRQCMHCVDPSCISTRSVSTLEKDPKTGIVHYDKDVYTSCRYCMVACPYNVLKYDYNNPFGVLHECEPRNQRGMERLDKGNLPGCVEVCPAGTVTLSTREESMTEAKKHLAPKPSSKCHCPRQTLKSGDTYLHMVPKYYLHLYGEKEGGDTQVLVLTGIPHENPDLSKLDDLSTGAHSEHVQHILHKGMILPLAVLADLTILVRRSTKDGHHDGEDDHES